MWGLAGELKALGLHEGQRLWMETVSTDSNGRKGKSMAPVMVAGLFPHCVIVKDTYGMLHGFNRESCTLELSKYRD